MARLWSTSSVSSVKRGMVQRYGSLIASASSARPPANSRSRRHPPPARDDLADSEDDAADVISALMVDAAGETSPPTPLLAGEGRRISLRRIFRQLGVHIVSGRRLDLLPLSAPERGLGGEVALVCLGRRLQVGQ